MNQIQISETKARNWRCKKKEIHKYCPTCAKKLNWDFPFKVTLHDNPMGDKFICYECYKKGDSQ